MTNILVTGADGFIGRNLVVELLEATNFTVHTFAKTDSLADLACKIWNCDYVFHLAGENRPKNEEDFMKTNSSLTLFICKEISKKFESTGKKVKIIYSSSTQANLGNSYGKSKLAGENHIKKISKNLGLGAYIYRLPGVFGKWSKPNYNSVVATFCYNLARNLPITVNDGNTVLTLIYIDDLIDNFMNIISDDSMKVAWPTVKPEYKIKLIELAEKIQTYHNHQKMLVDNVGVGVDRALYSTYLSFLQLTNSLTKFLSISMKGVLLSKC